MEELTARLIEAAAIGTLTRIHAENPTDPETGDLILDTKDAEGEACALEILLVAGLLEEPELGS